MIYVVVGGLILLIPFILFFPIISQLIHYTLWKLTTSADSQSGYIQFQQSDSQSEYIQLQQSGLHYHIYGDRSTKDIPIVLLHGGLSNKLSWFSQIPLLVKSGYQVILIDTRGHGKSSLDDTEHCYELYANDVVNILDKLHIQTVDILGWSDGGNTALTLGHHYQERVNRIIAISANYHIEGLTKHTKNEINKPNTWLKRKFNQFWTRAAYNYPKLEKEINKLWSSAPQMTPEILQKINTLVLLIQGENDCITIEHAETMEKYLPDAQLKVIKGAGHSAPVTHAKETNKHILQFLKLSE